MDKAAAQAKVKAEGATTVTVAVAAAAKKPAESRGGKRRRKTARAPAGGATPTVAGVADMPTAIQGDEEYAEAGVLRLELQLEEGFDAAAGERNGIICVRCVWN